MKSSLPIAAALVSVMPAFANSEVVITRTGAQPSAAGPAENFTGSVRSHALSGIMSPFGGFTVRQIHTLAAYWVLVIVAVHLGLRWPMLMGVARKLAGITQPSAARTLVLRMIAVLIAIHGVWSSFALAVGTKLSMQMTLDWWNFEESVAGFFIHCIAILGLYICLTYYAMKGLQLRKRRSAAAIPENVHQ